MSIVSVIDLAYRDHKAAVFEYKLAETAVFDIGNDVFAVKAELRRIHRVGDTHAERFYIGFFESPQAEKQQISGIPVYGTRTENISVFSLFACSKPDSVPS